MAALVGIHQVDERQEDRIRHRRLPQQPAVQVGERHAQEVGNANVRVSLNRELEQLDADVWYHATTVGPAGAQTLGQPRQSIGRLRQPTGPSPCTPPTRH